MKDISLCIYKIDMKIFYTVIASLLALVIILSLAIDTVQNEQHNIDDKKGYNFSQFPDIYP